jgi:hypothetical protein
VNRTRWEAVRRWRDDLARRDPPAAGLSPEGAREAWRSAWALLDDTALGQLAQIPGIPYTSAAFVAAATVPGAPIEWCAALLGHGSEVVLKVPSGRPGWADMLHTGAARHDLPLTVSESRSSILGHPLVIAMGRDASLDAIGDDLAPETRYLRHGTKFSVAWVTGAPSPPDPHVPTGFEDTWGRVAADAALYDGRGCLSPAIVFTPLDPHAAAAALLAALDRALIWPVGELYGAEGAATRHRAALARIVGHAVESHGGSVHVLPTDRVVPAGLPRSIALCHAANAADAAAALSRWSAHLSTVGTDDPASAAVFHGAGASTVCALGRMQRPDVVRLHDGRPWTREILRTPTDSPPEG